MCKVKAHRPRVPTIRKAQPPPQTMSLPTGASPLTTPLLSLADQGLRKALPLSKRQNHIVNLSQARTRTALECPRSERHSLPFKQCPFPSDHPPPGPHGPGPAKGPPPFRKVKSHEFCGVQSAPPWSGCPQKGKSGVCLWLRVKG